MTNPVTNTVSTFIDSQLPQFVREDNPNFGAFLKAYYQWMETSPDAAVISEAKKLLSYKDIDRTTDAFIQYYINDFLPYFPNDVVIDEAKLIKAARNFYQKKGSIESVQFLFRILYGKEIEVYTPKESILKASDGKWTLPQSLRILLDSNTQNFDVNLLVGRQGLGSVSNASVIIESASKTVDPNLGFEIIELFVSNLHQNLSDLENLNVVYGYDNNGNPLVFSEKIIAALSDIKVNPKYRGVKYKGYVKDTFGNFTYQGDPVVITGGLAPNDAQAQKAIAYVGNVTSGSITSVRTLFGGYAYRIFPNTIVTVVNAPSDNTGAGANVVVQSYDTPNARWLLVNTDSIYYANQAASTIGAANLQFANVAGISNINTAIGTALSFSNLQFAAITSMNVINGGGAYTDVPSLSLAVTYYSDYLNDLSLTHVPSDMANNMQFIDDLGYIANAVVGSGGSGYSTITDKIVVPSAIGYGATFGFTTGTGGAITGVTVTTPGEGYIQLPMTLAVVNSANVQNAAAGQNAYITAYGFGQGAQLDVGVNQIGQVSDIRIISRGFDYISTPNVSLRVQDIVIDPIDPNTSFLLDTKLYQGSNANAAVYTAYIDSYNVASGVLRLYNYQGSLNTSMNLVSATINARVNLASSANVTTYGNGKAKANAIFLNGLIQYPGFFYNTDGMLSADKYLQDSATYHNFSYIIVVEKALNEYKNTLMQIAHPAGMDMLGKYSVIADEEQSVRAKSNISIVPVVAGSLSTNAYSNGVVVGTGTNFGTVGVAGDIIVFNTSDSSRYLQSKVINQIVNSTYALLESNSMFVFMNPVSVTNTTNVITGNNISGNIGVSDIIIVNVGGNSQTSIVQQILSINSISVNTIFYTTNTSMATVYPSINGASYSIVRTSL